MSCIVFFLANFQCFAQENTNDKQHLLAMYGIKTGFGVLGQQLSEGGTYRPILFLVHFELNFIKKPSNETGLLFRWYLEPQVNPVFLREKLSEYEFGVNAGLRLDYLFPGGWGIYAVAGVGPHYISVETERQAKGFIFSDNGGIGLYKNIFGKWNITAECRVRHISNANLQSPNDGINNLFPVVGISKSL